MAKTKTQENNPQLSDLTEETKKHITNSIMEKALELYKLEASEKDYESTLFDILAKSFKEKVK